MMTVEERAGLIRAMAEAARVLAEEADRRSAAWWASLAATDPAEKRRLFEISQGKAP